MDNDALEAGTVAKLMTPNPTMGTWIELASILLKDLKKAGIQLPESLPLDWLRKKYLEENLVNWRNTRIGHGAMGLSEDEEFREDIRSRIRILYDILSNLDKDLRTQELFLLYPDGRELLLAGAERARSLEEGADVWFRTSNHSVSFGIEPFIVIRKHERRGSGIYFFDNQRTLSLTHFLAYAEGSRASESITYFERLRRMMDSESIREDARPDDQYLSVDEIRELDLLQMSHRFVRPECLIDWLKGCLNRHKKGVFLLQMERGTGKSVFTEKLNCLFEKPVLLAEDLDVRTYHFSRAQSAGISDFYSTLEWQWTNEYKGNPYVRASRISDYERKGKNPAEALCAWLQEIQQYRLWNSKKHRLLIVLDGLDEITEDVLWSFIPTEEMIGDGIYFLLTSRNPTEEKLPIETAERIRSISATEELCSKRQDVDNIQFLWEYIRKTKLGKTDKDTFRKIVSLSDYRVLSLGMLCRLAESGMPMEDLPNSKKVVSVYLQTLNERYGEKEANSIRVLLAIMSTLGMMEPLSLQTLASLSGQSGITIGLIGMVRDLSPFLKAERCQEGNGYTIANPGLALQLTQQIPELEETVRCIVQLTMSIMRDKQLLKEKEIEPAAAHIVEMALDYLPEKTNIFDDDTNEVLHSIIQQAKENMTTFCERERTLNYQKQEYMYLVETLGEDHSETFKAKKNLAYLLHLLGHYHDALPLRTELYERKNINFGAWHPETLSAQQDLSSTLNSLGHYNIALQLQQDIIKKMGKIYGENHPDTLSAKEDLADSMDNLGMHDNALQLQQEILLKRKNTLGAWHADTLRIQNSLLSTLGHLGKDEEALKMGREVFEKYKIIYGEDHHSTFTAQNNLATSLYKTGHTDEALSLIKQAFEKHKRILGEDHPDTLCTQINLATFLDETVQTDEALPLLKQVFEKCKNKLGDGHPYTLTAQNNLAISLRRIGQTDKALTLSKQVFEKNKTLFRDSHTNTQAALRNLVASFYKTSQTDEALSLLEQEFDICKKTLEEELDFYLQLFNARKKFLGLMHIDTLKTMNDIAWTFDKLNRYNKAVSIQEQLLRLRQKKCGIMDNASLKAHIRLAEYYQKAGRTEKAISTAEEVRSLLKNSVEDHEDLFTRINKILSGE